VNALTLEEFLVQLREMRKVGPIQKVLQALPGRLAELAGEIDEKELDGVEKILSAMTPEERRDSDLLIEESRRRRVAESAGRPLEEVNSLIAQFYAARRYLSDHGGTPN